MRAEVLQADSRFFTVIEPDILQEAAAEIVAEAESVGVRLNRLAAECVAAATVYEATIWFGHDRIVPRPIRDGLVPRPVRWRRLSELIDGNT